MTVAKINVILTVSVLCVLAGCAKHTTDADIENISLTELRSLLDRASESSDGRLLLLIDPRAPASFELAHIRGARNVQLSDIPLEPRLPEVESFDELVVYGDNPASGPAIAMTKRLIAAGYDDPRMFRDGLDAWRRAGFGVEGAEAAP